MCRFHPRDPSLIVLGSLESRVQLSLRTLYYSLLQKRAGWLKTCVRSRSPVCMTTKTPSSSMTVHHWGGPQNPESSSLLIKIHILLVSVTPGIIISVSYQQSEKKNNLRRISEFKSSNWLVFLYFFFVAKGTSYGYLSSVSYFSISMCFGVYSRGILNDGIFLT